MGIVHTLLTLRADQITACEIRVFGLEAVAFSPIQLILAGPNHKHQTFDAG